MNKSVGVVVAIIVVVVIALGGWYLVSNHNKNSNTMGNMNMSSGSTSNSGGQKPQATDVVAIQNFAFSPANITVKVGTTVTWTNKDSVPHTVTETDGQTGPSSGDLNPSASYTFKFTKAGTYHYNCSIHTYMVGTVTVTS